MTDPQLFALYELPNRLYWQTTYRRGELLTEIKEWAKVSSIDLTRRSNPEEIWIHDSNHAGGVSWVLVMPSSLSAEMVFRIWEELRR